MIYPAILCGGSGTRLWPLSRKSLPKQFSRLNGDVSLLQQTVARVSSEEMQAPIVLTNSDYRFTVAEQLSDAGARMKAFVEKTDQETAEAFLDCKRHLWNAGIFIFIVSEVLEVYEVLAPRLMIPVRRAVDGARTDLCFLRLGETPYMTAEDISIDYAVMEGAGALSPQSHVHRSEHWIVVQGSANVPVDEDVKLVA